MVRSRKNQYLGINVHAHNYLQGSRDWLAFHNAHLNDLTRALRDSLYPYGYFANMEQSVQIRSFLGDKVSEPRADILVYEGTKTAFSPSSYAVPVIQELVAPIPQLIGSDPEDEFVPALKIYPLNRPNEPVAWLELLSPSNKTVHRHEYRHKREQLLQSGMVYIELDYLNQTPPILENLPTYTPYYIAVLDPRPNWQDGEGKVYQFGVDMPIPQVILPLLGEDRIPFAFDAPYQSTFEGMLYGLELANYAELPPYFETHHPTEQLRILKRLIMVLQADDLDSPPMPLLPSEQTLEEALAEFYKLASQ